MSDVTTVLFGRPGVRVERVERRADGTRVVDVVTDGADGCRHARLRGGVEVGEGAVVTSPKDIPYGESRIVVRWTRFAGDAEKATANGSRLCAVQRTGRS